MAIVGDGVTFNLHSAIVCAKSPVIAKMLELRSRVCIAMKANGYHTHTLKIPYGYTVAMVDGKLKVSKLRN